MFRNPKWSLFTIHQFSCIKITEHSCLWLFGQKRERELLLLPSLAACLLPHPPLWCQFKSSRAAWVLCHGLCCCYHWVAPIPSLATIPRSIWNMLVVEVLWNQGVTLSWYLKAILVSVSLLESHLPGQSACSGGHRPWLTEMVQARASFLYVWSKPVGCFRDNGNAIDESGNNGLWRLIGPWMV